MNKYKVRFTKDFKKSLKKIKKQGKNIDKLLDVVELLSNDIELEPKYKNHKLMDNKYYKNCFDCHIEPDWLLIYRIDNDNLILLLVETGTHCEVFSYKY